MKKKTNLTNHKPKHLIYPSDLLGAIDVTESSSPPWHQGSYDNNAGLKGIMTIFNLVYLTFLKH